MTSMIVNLLAVTSVVIAIATAPFENSNHRTNIVSMVEHSGDVPILVEDNDFVLKAADGGMVEVRAAEVALKTSSNPDIKSFAQSMATDHSKANTELMALAKKKGIKTPTKLSEKGSLKISQLEAKTGAQFDQAYADAMVKDHEETIALFNTEASVGTDADLKKWAASKLPVLEHHLTMAQELAKKVQQAR